MAADPTNAAGKLLQVALVLAVGGAAWGKVLERGGTVKVLRQAPLREWHLYVFVPRDGDQARLQSLTPAIPRQRYSILDERGFLGEATVESVAKIEGYNPRCPSEHHYEATARFVPAHKRAVRGWMLGVGPASEPLRRGRVVPVDAVKGRVPPLREGKILSTAIDLDGEGEPELYSIDFACDGNRVVRRGSGKEICIELWSREGERWEVVATARTPDCD